jgi:hypothetical protein
VPAPLATWPVRVSQHALEQAADRAGVNDRTTIAEQVAAALNAGRVSAQRPHWLEPRANGHGLYCWDADQTVAFVLVAGDDHFLVVTTLTASQQAAA